MNFGEKLIKQRKGMQYTQEQLAEKLGVSRQAVSRWENDGIIPDGEKLKKLSDVLKVSIDYLMCDNCETEQELNVVKNYKMTLNKRWYAVSVALLIASMIGVFAIFLLSTVITVTEMKPLVSATETLIDTEDDQILTSNENESMVLYVPHQTRGFFPFVKHFHLEAVLGCLCILIVCSGIGVFCLHNKIVRCT